MFSMTTKSADIIYGIVTAAIAGALFVHTFSDVYGFNPAIESVSTVFFPRILLGGLVLCSFGLIFKGMRESCEEHTPAVNAFRVLAGLVVAASTAAGMWFVGYFIAMPIGVFLMGAVLGYPKKFILAGVAIVATGVVWFALGHFAAVTFPLEMRLF